MAYAPETEAVEICRDLIRIDTSNYGDDSGPGERAAAEYVAASLAEVGIESEVIESMQGRASVVARWGNQQSSRPGLLVHGHLDVVPAQATDWTVDPVDAGSRVIWREDIHVTGMPRFMDGVTKASSRALFSRVIDGLLR